MKTIPTKTVEEFKKMVNWLDKETSESINMFNSYAKIFNKIIVKLHDRIPDGDGLRGVLLSKRDDNQLKSLWITSGPQLYEVSYVAEADNQFTVHIDRVHAYEIFAYYDPIKCINAMIDLVKEKQEFVDSQKASLLELKMKLQRINPEG